MTDTRLPDRWLNDRRMNRSPVHFQSFVTALMWCVSNRTDGVIEPADLDLIPRFDRSVLADFIHSELFIPRGSGWIIPEFFETQTSKDQLESAARARKANSDRQARWRAKRAEQALQDSNVTNNVTETVTDAVIPQVGEVRQVSFDCSSSLKPVVTNWGTSLGDDATFELATAERGLSRPVTVGVSRLVAMIVGNKVNNADQTVLRIKASELENNGESEDDIAECLRVWLTKTELGAHALPLCMTEVYKRRNNGHTLTSTERYAVEIDEIGKQLIAEQERKAREFG